ncbi:MAG: NAD+ synthase [Caldisphaeraceae archaeon]|nr:NAD+ synthase [Caldisphaeraceae archaeon]
MKISINDMVNIDYDYAKNAIKRFLREELGNTGLSGYVIGLSGGVDSALSYFLATEAVGSDKVLALIMPDSSVTPKEDIEDAKDLVRIKGGQVQIINIDPIVEVYKSSIPIYEKSDLVPIGNIRARIRMSLLYFYANKLKRLVLGTGDRSEITIGYFTKYGDGGADLLPISNLLKTQVRRLASMLGIPERVAYKPSSPRLWEDQLAEKELGVSYETIDLIIYGLFDKGLDIEEFTKITGIDKSVVERVLELNRKTQHKRLQPASIPFRDVIRYL